MIINHLQTFWCYANGCYQKRHKKSAFPKRKGTLWNVTDPQRKRIVALHQDEGMSINDIAQKMNLKKHWVEGVLKGIQQNIDTPTETPLIGLQTPQQMPPLDTLPSVRERELALEIQLLQEKNRQKELEKELAALHYKQIEAKEQTERAWRGN